MRRKSSLPRMLLDRLTGRVQGSDGSDGGAAASAAAAAPATNAEKELRQRLELAEADLAKANKVVAALTRRHYFDLPLPPEALRLHVGKSSSAFNYWSQG